MLDIHFYPESDLLDFTTAVLEFRKIWADEGESVIEKWQEVTGLEFQEKHINAVVADLKSCSHPLTLRYNNNYDRKKSTLVHELGHRLLYKRVKGMGKKAGLEKHKFLFLVLFDVFMELYGDDFTRDVIEWDSQLGLAQGESLYKTAWEWALEHRTKAERQKVFNDILSGEVVL